MPFTIGYHSLIELLPGTTLRKPATMANKTGPPPEQVAESEQVQTTKFDNDKQASGTRLFRPMMDNSLLQDSRLEGRDHTIKDILSRPYLYQTGSWGLTDTTNSLLTSFSMPTALFTGTNVASKLNGFMIVRGTLHIKIVLNAQRMQQGRLLLLFMPSMSDGARTYQMDQRLITRTQRPRMDIDVSTDSDATMTVPYINQYLGYNLANNTGEVGSFQLVVYSPLLSPTGPSTVGYSIYVWMTDVELQYPTFTAQVLSEEVFTAQVLGSGRVKKRGEPNSAEESDTGSGLSLVKSVAAQMLKSTVPSISSFAGLPDWASTFLAGGAMALGWSKPIGDFMAGRVESGVFAHANHADSTTFARNMGMFTKNHVQAYPGFAGQDVDEMSIAYLAAVPTYHRSITWDVDFTAGSKLTLLSVTPSAFEESGVLWTYRSPFNYLAQFFNYFRGSIMYHFKFVKTEFHSGRLMVVWVPGTKGLSLTLDESQYCYREVLDIRESNEYSIVLPYVSNAPYSVKDNNGVFPPLGSLQIFVLNNLTAPANVAQSIDIIVEACACDDVEFAMPVRPICFPVAPGSNDAPALRSNGEVFTAQVLIEDKGKAPDEHPDTAWQRIFKDVEDRDEYHRMLSEYEKALINDPAIEATASLISAEYPWPYGEEGWTDFMCHGPKGFTTYTQTTTYLLYVFEKTQMSLHALSRMIGSKVDFNERVRRREGSPKSKRSERSSSRSQSVSPRKKFTARTRSPESEVFTAQVLGEDVCDDERTATIAVAGDPMCSDIKSENVSNATHCIGERITSIKQLLLRQTPWWATPAIATQVTIRWRNLFFSGVEANGNTVTRMPTSMDYLNLFAPLFAYYRGSVRYMLYTNSTTNTNTTMRVSYSRVDTQFGSTNQFNTLAATESTKLYNQSYNTAVAHSITAGGMEIQCPFYSNLPAQPVVINQAGYNVPGPCDGMVSLRTVSTTTTHINRAAGDDFAFGLFVGVPPTIYTFGLTGSLPGEPTW